MDRESVKSSSSRDSHPTTADNHSGSDTDDNDGRPIFDYDVEDGLPAAAAEPGAMLASTGRGGVRSEETDTPPPRPTCPLLATLPSEVVDAIVSFLSPIDLAVLSQTCRTLAKYASQENLWRRHVQEYVPGVTVDQPFPCTTFKQLYTAHDTRWFLPKYKIWFSDKELLGKLILVLYDPRRGSIEGYQLVATSNRTIHPQPWPTGANPVIPAFDPLIKLHLDSPVLMFDLLEDSQGDASRITPRRFTTEVSMALDDSTRSIGPLYRSPSAESRLSSFLLARSLTDEERESRLAKQPESCFWPPHTIPASDRVASVAGATTRYIYNLDFEDSDHAASRTEATDMTFRIRTLLVMNGYHENGIPAGESTDTFATLDPRLYTPTPTKPWRGIWVGDYSGHGCEFLLIHQPDDAELSDEQLGLARRTAESEESWQQRRHDARVHRGRLEAIKLTGDPNVPRGEYTFVVDDLGEKGFLGYAAAPFQGIRLVRSRGHVALNGFRNDKYIDSQLLLISHDRLAQFWVGFGHISFFKRVDIDQFLKPCTPAPCDELHLPPHLVRRGRKIARRFPLAGVSLPE